MTSLEDFVDAERVLDRWRASHGREVTLHSLRDPYQHRGFVARIASPRGHRYLAFLHVGGNLESMDPEAAMRLLRSGNANKSRVPASVRAAFGAQLLVLLALTGCGDNPTSNDHGAGPPSDTHSPSDSASPQGSGSASQPAKSLPAADCPIDAPEMLPDGSAPGAGRDPDDPASAGFATVWGSGANMVTVGRGREVIQSQSGSADGPIHLEGGFGTVAGPDQSQRQVVPVGDPPNGQIQYRYQVGQCAYIAWTEPGLTLAEAEKYARTF